MGHKVGSRQVWSLLCPLSSKGTLGRPAVWHSHGTWTMSGQGLPRLPHLGLHFRGPTANWGLPIATINDMKKSPRIIRADDIWCSLKTGSCLHDTKQPTGQGLSNKRHQRGLKIHQHNNGKQRTNWLLEEKALPGAVAEPQIPP